jgi:hypothetical protein
MVFGASQRTTRAAEVKVLVQFLMNPAATRVVQDKGMERVP